MKKVNLLLGLVIIVTVATVVIVTGVVINAIKALHLSITLDVYHCIQTYPYCG